MLEGYTRYLTAIFDNFPLVYILAPFHIHLPLHFPFCIKNIFKLIFYIAGFFGLYTIIQTAFLQGKLYSFLSKPLYGRPILNNKDVLDANLNIRFDNGMRTLFPNNDSTSLEIIKRAKPLMKGSFIDYAYQAYYNNSAVVIDESFFMEQPNLLEFLQVIELHNMIMCYYMPKNHIFYEFFERIVHRIIESGFLNQIVARMKFYHSNKQFIKTKSESPRVSLEHVNIAFFILLLGCCISTLFFALEILHHRNSLNKTSRLNTMK